MRQASTAIAPPLFMSGALLLTGIATAEIERDTADLVARTRVQAIRDHYRLMDFDVYLPLPIR